MPDDELAPGSGTEPAFERAPDAELPGSGTAPGEERRPDGVLAPGRGMLSTVLGRTPDEAPGRGTAPSFGIAAVVWTEKSKSTPAGAAPVASPTRVASSSHDVAAGFAALMPGSGTAMPDLVLGFGTFDGGGARWVDPGNAALPGRGTAPLAGIARVGAVSQSEGPAAPGSGTAPGVPTRVGASSQLVGEGFAADRPGSGTAPLDDDAGAAPPGSGTAPELMPGFTGKMVWHVGHLMRAPPAGIFLSSMVRLELHDGHATFMELLVALWLARESGWAPFESGGSKSREVTPRLAWG